MRISPKDPNEILLSVAGWLRTSCDSLRCRRELNGSSRLGLAHMETRAANAERAGLFRAASPQQVLRNLLWHRPDSPGASYHELRKVRQVDVFISHPWSSPRLLKALSICHHFNLDAAIASFILTWLLAVAAMLLRCGSWVALLEAPVPLLFLTCMCPPTAAFLLVLFGGHLLQTTTIWFDRLCVSQETPFSKLQTLQSIPAFVASSREMLVLWDANLFQRLWCNYELAVFAKTSVSTQAMHFMPLWVPLWTLASFGIFFLQVAVLFLVPQGAQPTIDADSRLELFWSIFNASQSYVVVFVVGGFPLSWFCLQKVRNHRSMLDGMALFDVRDAKCSLETDRVTIERHVLELFDEAMEAPLSVSFGAQEDEASDVQEALISREALESIRNVTSYPSKDEILDEFNAYVRGPLRDSVMHRLGSEKEISFKLCLIGILPLLFASPFQCCTNRDCQATATHMGIQSVGWFVVANVSLTLLFALLASTTVFPMLLRANAFITSNLAHSAWQLLLVLLTGLVLELLVGSWASFVSSLGWVVAAKWSPKWFLGLVGCLCLVSLQFWLLFFKPRKAKKPST